MTSTTPAEIPAEALAAASREALNPRWGHRLATALVYGSANTVNVVLSAMAEAIAGAAAPHIRAAERARIRDLAIRTRAVCTDSTEGTFCHFSALIEDEPGVSGG